MTETVEMCACGKPLHYSDPQLEKRMKQIVADRGPLVEVNVSNRRFLIPRHFIALHGIKGWEVPWLAEEFGFREVSLSW